MEITRVDEKRTLVNCMSCDFEGVFTKHVDAENAGVRHLRQSNKDCDEVEILHITAFSYITT